MNLLELKHKLNNPSEFLQAPIKRYNSQKHPREIKEKNSTNDKKNTKKPKIMLSLSRNTIINKSTTPTFKFSKVERFDSSLSDKFKCKT